MDINRPTTQECQLPMSEQTHRQEMSICTRSAKNPFYQLVLYIVFGIFRQIAGAITELPMTPSNCALRLLNRGAFPRKECSATFHNSFPR